MKVERSNKKSIASMVPSDWAAEDQDGKSCRVPVEFSGLGEVKYATDVCAMEEASRHGENVITGNSSAIDESVTRDNVRAMNAFPVEDLILDAKSWIFFGF